MDSSFPISWSDFCVEPGYGLPGGRSLVNDCVLLGENHCAARGLSLLLDWAASLPQGVQCKVAVRRRTLVSWVFLLNYQTPC